MNETVIDTLRGNEIVDVLEGPRRANGYQWYRIRKSNGVRGWVAESGEGQYWLRPCTPSRCPTSGDSLSDGGGRIAYGQRKNGRLSDRNYFDDWKFDARAGDRIIITMDKTSGNLDPVLRLYNSAGSELRENDDGGSGSNARIDDFRIPRSGQYTIHAARYGSSQTGEYRLSLSIDNSSSLSDGGGRISYGQTKSGALDDRNYFDDWKFDARAGDRITITMDKTSGSLDPVLRLYNSAGSELRENDDGGSGSNARIGSYRIPRSGQYTIHAARYGSGETGEYRLRLAVTRPTSAPTPTPSPTPTSSPTPSPSPTPTPSPTPAPETPRRSISYGEHKSGTLSGSGMYHLYAFTAAAGDEARIEMRRYPNANIAPSLSLWNDSGVMLAEDRNSSAARDAIIGSYIIPSDGSYIISANNNHDGDGRYELSLIRWEADDDEVVLDAPGSLAGIEYSRYTNPYRFPDQRLVEQGGFQEAIRVTVDHERGSLDKGLKVCLPEPDDGSTRNGIMMFLDESTAPPKLRPLYSWFERGSVCMGIRKPGTIVSMPASHQGAATLWSDTAKGIVVQSGLGEIVRRSAVIIVDGLIDKVSGKLTEKATGFAGSVMSKYGSKLPMHVANKLGKEVLGESGEALAKSAHKEVLTSQGLHRSAFRQMQTLLQQQHDEIFAAQYQAIVEQYVAEMGDEGIQAASLVALEATDEYIARSARIFADETVEEAAEHLTRETIEAAGRLQAGRRAKDKVLEGSARHIAKDFLTSDEGLEVTNSLGSLIEGSASEVLGDTGGEIAAFVTDIVAEVVAGKFTALFKSGVFAVDAARGIFADLGLNRRLSGCQLTVKELTPARQTPKGFIISYLPANAELNAIARTPNWFKVRLNEGWLENSEWVSAQSVWESGNCG